MTVKHVVSVSGGKDSLATLVIAIKRFGLRNIIAIFCDTGNEHELTYDYLAYLERRLGITIMRLKANFDAEIAGKRAFIANDQREIFAHLNIWSRIEWSKTTRGGKQFDLLTSNDDPGGCSSSYGLCEQFTPLVPVNTEKLAINFDYESSEA